jgi:DNA-binding CsgD family transcriptional regulator/tetratricopeptide (TPR) repeat protein
MRWASWSTSGCVADRRFEELLVACPSLKILVTSQAVPHVQAELDAQEQRLFRWLAVFVGGWTLEAVEAVVNLDNETGDVGLSVLDRVASLLDKSLLLQVEQEGEEPRLQMLMTVREYGLECLRESGEVEAVHRAHAEYYLRLVEEAEPHFKGPQQVEWLGRVEQEQENLQAALGWLIEHEEGELALRFCGALWWFWSTRSSKSEGQRWLEAALQLPTAQDRTAVRAKALNVAGEFAYAQQDLPAAQRLLSESVILSREVGDDRGLASSLGALGQLLQMQGELAAGRSLVEECMALCRTLGSTWDLSRLLLNAGADETTKGDITQDVALTQESLALAREVGDKLLIASALDTLGAIVLSQGDLTQATALFTEGLTLAQQVGDKGSIGLFLIRYAKIAVMQGQPQRATRLFGAAEAQIDVNSFLVPAAERAEYERDVAAVRAQLGEQAFVVAWAEGRSMTPQQALAAPELATIPEAVPAVPQPSVVKPPSAPAYPDDLTAREVEILRLVAQGWTDGQIAEHLVISPRTVNAHLTSIYRKIGVSSRSAATRYAMEHSLV